jgi:formylglycine-generating enzyme required for sulfatase activity
MAVGTSSSFAKAEAIKCEHLFLSESKALAIAENLAKLTYELENNPDVYSNPIETSRYSQKISEGLAELTTLDPLFSLSYYEKLKAFRLKIKIPDVEEVRRSEKLNEERLRQAEDAADPIHLAQHKIIFNEINPGSFFLEDKSKLTSPKKRKTEIEEPFAMMQTLVTQMMWARLKVAMGEKFRHAMNPSHFSRNKNDETVIVNIEGYEIPMQPDHPVERVSADEVDRFVVELNILSQSAEEKNQTLLRRVIPGHQKGDVYDLPTDKQWAFVMKNRGQTAMKFFNSDEPKLMARYAWTSGNSGRETHAVATRLPRKVDGNLYYDLEGNVKEWTKSWMRGDLGKTERIIRGGSDWSSSIESAGSYRDHRHSHVSSSVIGFRLVRTRPVKVQP